MEKSWARRTSALYTAVSPCGWYLPSTSPTTRAHLQAPDICAQLLDGIVRGPADMPACIWLAIASLLLSPICAHLRCGFPDVMPSSCMAKRMRRCTGFRPSRTSGSARPTMTDMAYCRAGKGWPIGMLQIQDIAQGNKAAAGTAVVSPQDMTSPPHPAARCRRPDGCLGQSPQRWRRLMRP